VVEWDLRQSLRSLGRSNRIYWSQGENSESSYFNALYDGLLGLEICLTLSSDYNRLSLRGMYGIDELQLQLLYSPAIMHPIRTCLTDILGRMGLAWAN
jgi:hypothetical protein